MEVKVYWREKRREEREKERNFDKKRKDGSETGGGKWFGRIVATSTL